METKAEWHLKMKIPCPSIKNNKSAGLDDILTKFFKAVGTNFDSAFQHLLPHVKKPSRAKEKIFTSSYHL